MMYINSDTLLAKNQRGPDAKINLQVCRIYLDPITALPPWINVTLLFGHGPI